MLSNKKVRGAVRLKRAASVLGNGNGRMCLLHLAGKPLEKSNGLFAGGEFGESRFLHGQQVLVFSTITILRTYYFVSLQIKITYFQCLFITKASDALVHWADDGMAASRVLQ